MSDFFEEIRNAIEAQSGRLSKYTVSTYMGHISKIRQYRSQLDCSDIDRPFLDGYVDFMKARDNAEGTIFRSLAVLRNFVNILQKCGKIEKSPFENYRMSHVRSRRHFLEIDELRTLYDGFLDKGDSLTFAERESLRAFLFSCFTGLRYADLKSLCFDDVKNGKIQKWTQKTGQMVYIPIPEQAKVLLGDVPQGKVLHVVNNSCFNRNLRSGAKKIGFQRYLHAHLARHTFATACISLGIPIEIVSKMLGHSVLSTTLIYANYVDATIDRVMSKFSI